MTDGADVRSLAALRDWHATLAAYGETLAEALAGIGLELRRAADWLDEQQELWQRAVRDREEDVIRAKAELAQRRFPTWDGRLPDCTVQEKNLRRAEAALEAARAQVEQCRRWRIRLPKLVEETYTGASRRLAHFLEAELPRALADLARRIAILEHYADSPAGVAHRPAAVAPPPPLAAPESPSPPTPPRDPA